MAISSGWRLQGSSEPLACTSPHLLSQHNQVLPPVLCKLDSSGQGVPFLWTLISVWAHPSPPAGSPPGFPYAPMGLALISTARLCRAMGNRECPTQNGALSLQSLLRLCVCGPPPRQGSKVHPELRCFLTSMCPPSIIWGGGLGAGYVRVGHGLQRHSSLLQNVEAQGCCQDALQPLLRPPALGAPGGRPCSAAGGHQPGHLG